MGAAVIINPISGAGGRVSAARSRVERVRAMLRRHGREADVFVTERQGHARELAAALADRGVALVFVWGGDGTVNEVGSALAHREAALAILPSGSGNGLAVELGIDRHPEAAMAAALAGRDRRIDAGELGGRLFFNIAGVGFDARIAREFNRRADGRRGPLPYVTIGLREVWRYVPARYRLELDGSPAPPSEALLVIFANSGRYGGWGSVVAPAARLDDGRLDVLVVDHRSIAGHLWRARHLLTGRADRAEGVVRCQIASGSIAADAPMEFHVDGEWTMGGTRLDVRVHPGALRVRAV
jgi:YegS/Rv2252/BmrU family lipid kinase